MRTRFLAGMALTSLALMTPVAANVPQSQVTVPKDFKLDLIYTVPASIEGSWVAMCLDPKGRLIVGDQYGKLYRMVLPPTNQTGSITAEPIDLDIGGRARAALRVRQPVRDGERRERVRTGCIACATRTATIATTKSKLLRRMDISAESTVATPSFSPPTANRCTSSSATRAR